MPTPSKIPAPLLAIVNWVDSYAGAQEPQADDGPDRVDWIRCIPFIALHLGCLGVFLVGWSWTAVAVAIALYGIRGFAVTGFYHRYFSHRTFKTSRPVQFLFAAIANSSGQRGPLWWSAHHRHHHTHSDCEGDIHSPRLHGFLWSHMGWFTSRRNFRTNLKAVPDFAKYPELVFLDRFDVIAPLALAAGLFGAGELLRIVAPGLGVTGAQLFVWGFCISTVLLFHVTSAVNSVGHSIGRHRFETGDDSGNSFWLALITLGEGWHNNHHRYPTSTRQGIRWWEVDLTYYALFSLSILGAVWDLRTGHVRPIRAAQVPSTTA